MAPRTRSNRQEKLAIQKLLSSGISPNTRGFPALPNELYLEILSYLPALPIPHDVEKMDPYRQITLYYLSQTCRSLRKFFLRYAWERIEVFEGMWSPKGRLTTKAERNKRGVDMKNLSDKRQIQETLRQLKTATVRNPDLRQYVSWVAFQSLLALKFIISPSIVNLTILEYSYDSVLPEIAQNLSLFPNLHSLQLISRFVPHEPDQFFSEFRYPNVHTLNVIRLKYGDIFHACPNARYVSSSLHIREILYKECASGIEKLRHVKGLRHFLNGKLAYLLLSVFILNRFADMVRLLPCLCDLFLGLRNLRTSGVWNYWNFTFSLFSYPHNF